eukprot:m.98071 g.98071  ORF g.98071 m.98071 type:complete len:411 (-) comp8999_c0_seq5:2987-4219(-)
MIHSLFTVKKMRVRVKGRNEGEKWNFRVNVNASSTNVATLVSTVQAQPGAPPIEDGYAISLNGKTSLHFIETSLLSDLGVCNGDLVFILLNNTSMLISSSTSQQQLPQQQTPSSFLQRISPSAAIVQSLRPEQDTISSVQRQRSVVNSQSSRYQQAPSKKDFFLSKEMKQRLKYIQPILEKNCGQEDSLLSGSSMAACLISCVLLSLDHGFCLHPSRMDVHEDDEEVEVEVEDIKVCESKDDEFNESCLSMPSIEYITHICSHLDEYKDGIAQITLSYDSAGGCLQSQSEPPFISLLLVLMLDTVVVHVTISALLQPFSVLVPLRFYQSIENERTGSVFHMVSTLCSQSPFSQVLKDKVFLKASLLFNSKERDHALQGQCDDVLLHIASNLSSRDRKSLHIALNNTKTTS